MIAARRSLGLAGASALLLPLALTGCVANDSSGGDTQADGADKPIEVTIKDASCEVSTNSVPSGRVTFKLTNAGTVRNEFEILAPDRLRIVGERENLGPGTTTDYTVLLEPGEYVTACKKNMVGSLVGAADFTVTKGEDVEVSADDKQVIEQAVTNYTAYVRDQTGQLLTATQDFVKTYKAGDTEARRRLTRRRVCTTSASSPPRKPSATLTPPSTSARRTIRRPMTPRAASGLAGTPSRRTCGARPTTRA